MGCKECSERRKLAREALLRGAIGESISHVAKGAAELIGIKEKTAVAERNQANAKRESGTAGKPAKPAKPVQE